MINLRPCDEVVQEREQIRDALLMAFNDVIRDTPASDSDEMAGRTLLDVVAYVISFKVPAASLDDRAEIRTFTRNETLRFELYLREHLLRRAGSDTLALADGEDIPTQPTGSDDGIGTSCSSSPPASPR
ncbi:MAG: hypothetical protein R3D62_06455 [Xanthobacteraceae bacterium]